MSNPFQEALAGRRKSLDESRASTSGAKREKKDPTVAGADVIQWFTDAHGRKIPITPASGGDRVSKVAGKSNLFRDPNDGALYNLNPAKPEGLENAWNNVPVKTDKKTGELLQTIPGVEKRSLGTDPAWLQEQEQKTTADAAKQAEKAAKTAATESERSAKEDLERQQKIGRAGIGAAKRDVAAVDAKFASDSRIAREKAMINRGDVTADENELRRAKSALEQESNPEKRAAIESRMTEINETLEAKRERQKELELEVHRAVLRNEQWKGEGRAAAKSVIGLEEERVRLMTNTGRRERLEPESLRGLAPDGGQPGFAVNPKAGQPGEPAFIAAPKAATPPKPGDGFREQPDGGKNLLIPKGTKLIADGALPGVTVGAHGGMKLLPNGQAGRDAMAEFDGLNEHHAARDGAVIHAIGDASGDMMAGHFKSRTTKPPLTLAGVPPSWLTPAAGIAQKTARQVGKLDFHLPAGYEVKADAVAYLGQTAGRIARDANGLPRIYAKAGDPSPSLASGNAYDGVPEYADVSPQFRDYLATNEGFDKAEAAEFQEQWAAQHWDAGRVKSFIDRWQGANDAERGNIIAEVQPSLEPAVRDWLEGKSTAMPVLDTRGLYQSGAISRQEARMLERTFYGAQPVGLEARDDFAAFKAGDTDAAKMLREMEALPHLTSVNKYARTDAAHQAAVGEWRADYMRRNGSRVDFDRKKFLAETADIAGNGLGWFESKAAKAQAGVSNAVGSVAGMAERLYRTGASIAPILAGSPEANEKAGGLSAQDWRMSAEGTWEWMRGLTNNARQWYQERGAAKRGETTMEQDIDTLFEAVDAETLTETQLTAMARTLQQKAFDAKGWGSAAASAVMQGDSLIDGQWRPEEMGGMAGIYDATNDDSPLTQALAAYKQTGDPAYKEMFKTALASTPEQMRLAREVAEVASNNGLIAPTDAWAVFNQSRRGMQVAGGQEFATEIAGTALSAGIGKALILGTRGTKWAARAGMGAAAANQTVKVIDDIITAGTKAGRPLTNMLIQGGKAVAANTATEYAEEAVTALGEPGANFAGRIHEAGMQGAWGGGGMAAVGLGLGAASVAAQTIQDARVVNAFVKDWNARTPGDPITGDDFKQARTYVGPQTVQKWDDMRLAAVVAYQRAAADAATNNDMVSALSLRAAKTQLEQVEAWRHHDMQHAIEAAREINGIADPTLQTFTDAAVKAVQRQVLTPAEEAALERAVVGVPPGPVAQPMPAMDPKGKVIKEIPVPQMAGVPLARRQKDGSYVITDAGLAEIGKAAPRTRAVMLPADERSQIVASQAAANTQTGVTPAPPGGVTSGASAPAQTPATKPVTASNPQQPEVPRGTSNGLQPEGSTTFTVPVTFTRADGQTRVQEVDVKASTPEEARAKVESLPQWKAFTAKGVKVTVANGVPAVQGGAREQRQPAAANSAASPADGQGSGGQGQTQGTPGTAANEAAAGRGLSQEVASDAEWSAQAEAARNQVRPLGEVLRAALAGFGYKIVDTGLPFGFTDRYGAFHSFGTQILDKKYPGSDIGQWIDHVTNSPVADMIKENMTGPGLHRVWFGHDPLANLGTIIDKFGITALPEYALQLVKDMTTRSGIPLPGVQWLVHKGIIGDSAATEWLSLNVGEALGAGFGILGTYKLFKKARDGKEIHAGWAMLGIGFKLVGGVLSANPILLLTGLADVAIMVAAKRGTMKAGVQKLREQEKAGGSVGQKSVGQSEPAAEPAAATTGKAADALKFLQVVPQNDALRALARLPKGTRARGVELIGRLDRVLEKLGGMFSGGIAFSEPGTHMRATRMADGTVQLNVNLDEFLVQFQETTGTAAVQSTVEEEIIHAAAMAALNDNEVTGLWRSLPAELQQTVYSAYNVASIAEGSVPAQVPARLTDDDAWMLGHEFVRMLVQDSEFQGRVTEAVETSPSLGEKLIQFLQKLAGELRRLIAGIEDPEVKGRIAEYEGRVKAALKQMTGGGTRVDLTGGGKAVRQSDSGTVDGESLPGAVLGADGTAYTEGNEPIGFQWAVVEADSLTISNTDDGRINPAYPQELQPRDRTSAASEAQVNDIARNANLDRLSHSNGVGDGAPFVGPDGVVESGNGRVMGLARAYGTDLPSIALYKQNLAARASEFGINEAALISMKRPILVRVRTTNVDRAAFAQAANVTNIAPMREVEIAKKDAGNLTPAFFDSFNPSADGDIFSASNADFIRGFVRDVVPQTERAAMVDRRGNLTQTGLRRIRNAVFAYAYGTSAEALDALSRLTEDIDPANRSVTNALVSAAPIFAEQKARMDAGALHPLDITGELVQAITIYNQLRARGETVADHLAQAEMPGMGAESSPLVDDMLGWIEANKRSGARMFDTLRAYAVGVEQAGDPRQGALFGGEAKPTKEGIWGDAKTQQGQPPERSLSASPKKGILSRVISAVKRAALQRKAKATLPYKPQLGPEYLTFILPDGTALDSRSPAEGAEAVGGYHAGLVLLGYSTADEGIQQFGTDAGAVRVHFEEAWRDGDPAVLGLEFFDNPTPEQVTALARFYGGLRKTHGGMVRVQMDRTEKVEEWRAGSKKPGGGYQRFETENEATASANGKQVWPALVFKAVDHRNLEAPLGQEFAKAIEEINGGQPERSLNASQRLAASNTEAQPEDIRNYARYWLAADGTAYKVNDHLEGAQFAKAESDEFDSRRPWGYEDMWKRGFARVMVEPGEIFVHSGDNSPNSRQMRWLNDARAWLKRKSGDAVRMTTDGGKNMLNASPRVLDSRIEATAKKLGIELDIDPAWGLPRQARGTPAPPTARWSAGDTRVELLVERAVIEAEIVLDDDGTRGRNPLLDYLEAGRDYSRAELHEAIVSLYTARGKKAQTLDGKRGQAFFIGGGPAAGKSTFLREMQASGQLPANHLSLTADDIKLLLPEMQTRMAAGDPSAAGSVHVESQQVFNMVQEALLLSGMNMNLVWDATLSRPAEVIPLLQRVGALGYERHLRGILIDPWEAVVRSAERGLKTKRLVPVSGVVSGHKGFQAGFSKYFEHVESHEIRGIMFGDSVYSNGGENLRVIVVASSVNPVEKEAGMQYDLAHERGKINDRASDREALLASYAREHPAHRDGEPGRADQAGGSGSNAGSARTTESGAGDAARESQESSGRLSAADDAGRLRGLASGNRRMKADTSTGDLFEFAASNQGFNLLDVLTPAQQEAKAKEPDVSLNDHLSKRLWKLNGAQLEWLAARLDSSSKSRYALTNWPDRAALEKALDELAPAAGGLTGGGKSSQPDASTTATGTRSFAPAAGADIVPQSNHDAKAKQSARLAGEVAKILKGKSRFKKLTWETLFKLADDAFGGTQANGAYSVKDAYDAMEMGVNLELRRWTTTGSAINYNPEFQTALEAAEAIGFIKRVLSEIPTQTKRTQETDDFQQFSTVPSLAFVANWVAGVNSSDVMLEPSAGVGGMAVFAKNAGATVIANELSPRRAALIKESGIADQVFTEDAEQIDNILPREIKPTVVVMNPPFSNAATRGVKGKTETATRHIEQALARLQPGGRLVAIVGEGMAWDRPAFRGWWQKISKEFTVRANVQVNGAEYAKYGTTWDNQIVVIDKVKPAAASGNLAKLKSDRQKARDKAVGLTNASEEIRVNSSDAANQMGKDAREAWAEVERLDELIAASETGRNAPITGRVEKVEELPALLQAVRNERPESSGSISLEPRGDRPAPRGDAAVGAGAPALAPGARADEGPGQPAVSGGALAGQAGTRDGRDGSGNAGQGVAPAPPAASGEAGRDSGSAAPGSVTSTPVTNDEAMTDAVYDRYEPRVTFEGSHPPPVNLAESAAMAAITPPKVTYTPAFSTDYFNDKNRDPFDQRLAWHALESIALAGHAHQQTVAATTWSPRDAEDWQKRFGTPPPEKYRRGFFIGDGTGSGKGRQVAGIILDNWKQGRTRAVWVSEKPGLIKDAKRDLNDVAGPEGIATHLFDVTDTSAGDKINKGKGVAFISYATLRSREMKPKAGTLPKTRVDQMVEWLGADFDGVIAFDEAHNMANAVAQEATRGMKEASQQALAGIELQRRLPNARVVYLSATGATEVSNLAYAERLGLWGPGTPFQRAEEFISKIAAGGVAAMELIAQNLKAMGLYLARAISWHDVTYDPVKHNLTPEQREIYDALAEGWQVALRDMQKAMEVTGIVKVNDDTGAKSTKNSSAKSAILSKFWGGHQRFFNQLITSMKLPTVLTEIEKQLGADKSIVIQLVNTQQASAERAIGKAAAAAAENDEAIDLESLDMSPKDQLLGMVQSAFPVIQMEEYSVTNEQTGQTSTYSRPVLDSKGNPVLNNQAVAMREALLDKLASVRVPDGPLEQLLDHFGAENVSEITGRTRRVVWTTNKQGERVRDIEKRSPAHRSKEVAEFQEGKRRILVFSKAGGTGESFHADRRAKNQQKRVHILLQPGWQASAAVQGFGRTHRNNQVSAPHYILAQTDVVGEARFMSSIARRLDQLGALTKGQRQTGSQGFFQARDNLESAEAKAALDWFYRDAMGGALEGITPDVLEEQMGLKMKDKDGNALQNLPPITQFLNRLLSLKLGLQTAVFNAFSEKLDRIIETKLADGTLDQGLETLKALSTKETGRETVFEDPKNGGMAELVSLELTHPREKNTFEHVSELVKYGGNRSQVMPWVMNKRTGKPGAITGTRTTTLRSGAIGDEVRIVSAGDYKWVSTARLWENWERSTEKEARDAWESALAEVPDTRTEGVHLLTGTMLPIWDKIPGAPRILRAQTDEGRRMIGRDVPASQVPALLLALGKKGNTITAQDAMRAVERGGTARLSNKWTVKTKVVSGESRVELIGPGLGDHTTLDAADVFRERISFQMRYFLPRDRAAEVLDKVMKAMSLNVTEAGGGERSLSASPRRLSSAEAEAETQRRTAAFEKMRQIGVSEEDAELILRGEKTPAEVVDETLGVSREKSGAVSNAKAMEIEEREDGSRSLFVEPGLGESASGFFMGQTMSHAEAMQMAVVQAVGDIHRILVETGVSIEGAEGRALSASPRRLSSAEGTRGLSGGGASAKTGGMASDSRAAQNANEPSPGGSLNEADAKYFSAIQSGDMEKAQVLVDAVAINAGLEKRGDSYYRITDTPMVEIGDQVTTWRKGAVPDGGYSYNFRDQQFEAGVSSYWTPIAQSMAGMDTRPWYQITGPFAGYGSDGEPLIGVKDDEYWDGSLIKSVKATPAMIKEALNLQRIKINIDSVLTVGRFKAIAKYWVVVAEKPNSYEVRAIGLNHPINRPLPSWVDQHFHRTLSKEEGNVNVVGFRAGYAAVIVRDDTGNIIPPTRRFSLNKKSAPVSKGALTSSASTISKQISIRAPKSEETTSPQTPPSVNDNLNPTGAEGRALSASARVATAAASVDTAPTEAQKKAGNYQKGHVHLHGLDISIENPRGSTRSGKDRDGKTWSVTMPHHYGYLRRTKSADDDNLDVFIGPNPESTKVFIIDQVKQGNGHFDEHKVMLGFDTEADARAGYEASFANGWKVGPMFETTLDDLKKWIAGGDLESKAREQFEEDQATSNQQPASLSSSPRLPGTMPAGRGVINGTAQFVKAQEEAVASQISQEQAERDKTLGAKIKGAGVKGIKREASEAWANVVSGNIDRLDYYAPGFRDIWLDSERKLGLARAAVNGVMEKLHDRAKAGFGYPAWWKNPLVFKRWKRFQAELLPVAARLEVESINPDGSFAWKPFDMRAGDVDLKTVKALGKKAGDTMMVRGEELLIGRLYEETASTFQSTGVTVKKHLLLRPMSAAAQQQVYDAFINEWSGFPVARELLDEFIMPGMAGARETGPRGIRTAAFNRYSLLDFFNEWPPELQQLFGPNPLPNIPQIAGYTPDLFTLRGLSFMIAGLAKAFKSGARQVKSGAARESGNVQNLMEGFSTRLMEAHREKISLERRTRVINAAAKPMMQVPKEDKHKWLPLNDAFNKLYELAVVAKGLDRQRYPKITGALSPDQEAFMRQLVGEAWQLRGRNLVVPEAIYKDLVGELAVRDAENLLLKAVEWLIDRFNAASLASAGYIAMNWLGNEIMKTSYMTAQAIKAGALLAAGEGKRARLAFDTMSHMVKGMVVDRFPLRQQRIRDIVPRELFDNDQAIRALKGLGETVGDNLKSINVGGAVLAAMKAGNWDVGAKMQLAYAAYRAHMLAAWREHVTGASGPVPSSKADREAWMKNWLEKDAPDTIHREVQLAAALYLMDYQNVPRWMDANALRPVVTDPDHPARGVILNQAMRLAIKTVIPFIRWQYSFAKSVKHQGWNGGLRPLLAGSSTKKERAEAAANVASLGMMVFLPALIATLSEGDDDDDDKIAAELVGRVKDLEGRKLPDTLSAKNRFNVSALARILATRLGMDGMTFDVQDEAGDESDLWMRYRNYPYIKEGIVLGLAAMGEKEAFGESWTSLFQEYASLGIAWQAAETMFGARDQYGTPEAQLGGMAFDVATSPVIPHRILRDVTTLIDPSDRRLTPSKGLDYTPGFAEGIKSRIPRLKDNLPLAGDVKPKAIISAKSTVPADVQADLAREYGIDYAQVNREKGKHRDTFADLIKLRHLGATSTDVKITTDDKGRQVAVYPDPDQVRKKNRAFEAVRSISAANLLPVKREAYREAVTGKE